MSEQRYTKIHKDTQRCTKINALPRQQQVVCEIQMRVFFQEDNLWNDNGFIFSG